MFVKRMKNVRGRSSRTCCSASDAITHLQNAASILLAAVRESDSKMKIDIAR